MAVSQSLSVTEVADSVSIADNASKVKIVWISTQTGESWNGYTRTAYYWISINGGAETKYSVSYTLPQYSTKTILSKTITVPHKGDGSGTVKVRTWMDTDISADVVELSKTLTLTTIPRASTLESLACSTNYFTGTMTYKYTPKSSAMYNRCNISLNLDGEYISVKSINLGQKAASQQTATVTLSEDELTTIYKKLPGTTKGVLRFTFRTYSNAGYSSQVGSTSVKELTLYIPNTKDTQPAVGMTLAPVSSLGATFKGLYIQGKTKVKATLDADPKYGAIITGYSMKVEGVVYGPDYTSEYLSQYGSIAVYGYASDTRGYQGSIDKTIAVIAYAKPKILDATAERCDVDGNADDGGTYLKITAKRSYSKVVSDGVQKNFCAIRYRWKSEQGAYSEWNTILAGSASGDTITTGALLGGALAVDTTYLVQVGVVDDIGETAHTTIVVPTDKVYCHRDGARRSFTFGGYVEEDNTFAIAGDVKFHAKGGIARLGLYDYNDFNELVYLTGYYTSTGAPGTVGCSNYPANKTGALEVISQMAQNKTTGAWWGFAYQTYRTHDGEVYTRSYYTSAGWSAWILHNGVVESGVSGIWRYMKFANGTALCWGTHILTDQTFETAWGSLYVNGTPTPKIAYPITFVARPNESVQIRAAGSACWLYTESNGNSVNTATATAQYAAARPTAVTVAQDIRFDFTVFGRWK